MAIPAVGNLKINMDKAYFYDGEGNGRGVFWQFSAQMMGDAYRNSTTASEDKDADHVEMLARLLGIELAKRCRVVCFTFGK